MIGRIGKGSLLAIVVALSAWGAAGYAVGVPTTGTAAVAGETTAVQVPLQVPAGQWVKLGDGKVCCDRYGGLEDWGPLPGLAVFWTQLDHMDMTGTWDPVRKRTQWIHAGRIPPRSCGYCLFASEQDMALYDPVRFLSEWNHNGNGWGGISKDFKSVDVPGFSGVRLWVYSLARNKWYAIRPPTVIEKIGLGYKPPGAGVSNVQYDSFHDVIVHGEGRVIACHTNECFELKCGLAAREDGTSAVDSLRGVYYMSRTDGSLEVLDLDAEAWRTLEVKLPIYSPRRPGFGALYASMVYDAHHDKMLYMDCEGAAHPKTDNVRNIWTLDCGSRKLETLPVPANLARGHFTKLAYSPALDLSLFMEKTGPYASRMAGEDAFGRLAPPPDLSVDMSSGQVKLSWQPVKADGVTGYAVWRGEASRFPRNFKKIAETKASETSFADGTVAAGSKHAYRVYALRVDAQGRPSRLAYTQPIWVHGVVASVEDKDSVRVSWEKNPEPDIVGYNVYRAKGADMFDYRAFKYDKVNAAPVKGEEFADKVDLSDGVARSYIVRAVNAFGVESGYSDLATTFPNPPEWVTMKEIAPGRIQVSWKPPERQKVVGVELWAAGKSDGRTSEEPITENVFEIDKKQVRWYQLRAVNVLGQAGFTSHQVVPGMGVENRSHGNFTGFLPEDKVFRYSDYVPDGAAEGR